MRVNPLRLTFRRSPKSCTRGWKLDQNAPARRKIEDHNSCRRLGASSRYYGIPDCIYRRDPGTGGYMYADEAALNGMLQPGDFQVIHSLQDEVKQPQHLDANFVCPLALGNHVDHQLTRSAAEGISNSYWYYADFPYVLHDATMLEQMEAEGWANQVFPISQDGLAAWGIRSAPMPRR